MDPNVFGFQFSLTMIAQAISGGMTSIWGGVLGAALITGVGEALRYLSVPLWESVILGALTVAVLIALPRSIAGLIADLWHATVRPSLPPTPTPRDLALPPPRGVAAAWPRVGPLLSVRDVSKSFGSVVAVNDVSLDIVPGSITALIGPNGAGKTTLFNLISGVLPLDLGTIRFDTHRIDRLPMHSIAT